MNRQATTSKTVRLEKFQNGAKETSTKMSKDLSNKMKRTLYRKCHKSKECFWFRGSKRSVKRKIGSEE